ncbi:MAG: hypothetical protein II881_02935 [Oscillospiraceae bacterium]|nr:hypothetical protein [Oscillospiraceae bacterium]
MKIRIISKTNIGIRNDIEELLLLADIEYEWVDIRHISVSDDEVGSVMSLFEMYGIEAKKVNGGC